MTDSLKKSFIIIKDNPLITLTFVIYLIILITAARTMFLNNNPVVAIVLGILMMLLTAAFAAGWCGIIKSAVRCYKKEKTVEEKIEDITLLKNNFFSSIPTYFLPILTGMILLIAIIVLFEQISSHLFGRLDSVINQINLLPEKTDASFNYLMSLPYTTQVMIAKKIIFSIFISGFLGFISMLYAASLFLNKQESKNPFKAILYTCYALFKMPFTSIALFIFITLINFALIIIQAVYIENVIISFVTMILRIYFVAYVIVLIFDIYDKKITNYSNNGSDCIRENEVID